MKRFALRLSPTTGCCCCDCCCCCFLGALRLLRATGSPQGQSIPAGRVGIPAAAARGNGQTGGEEGGRQPGRVHRGLQGEKGERPSLPGHTHAFVCLAHGLEGYRMCGLWPTYNKHPNNNNTLIMDSSAFPPPPTHTHARTPVICLARTIGTPGGHHYHRPVPAGGSLRYQ